MYIHQIILKKICHYYYFLPGIGEIGTNICDIEKYALPKYLNKMDIPFIVIVP